MAALGAEHAEKNSWDQKDGLRDHGGVIRFLLTNGADFDKLERPLADSLIGDLGVSPTIGNSQQFGAALQAMSLVAALVATITYVGWLNPPGGFDGAASLLEKH